MTFSRLVTAVAMVVLPGIAIADCLAPGECTTVTHELPDLNDPGNGFPVGCFWDPAPGLMWEDDILFDDPMGEAEADGNTIQGEVCNHGGNLFGPNGENQGDGCIEPYFCRYYNYTGTVERCISATIHIGNGGSGIGGGTCVTVTVNLQSTYCTEPSSVCAC